MTSDDYSANKSDMERKIKIMLENDIPQRIHIPGVGRKYVSRKMIDDLKFMNEREGSSNTKKEGGILPLLPALLAMLVSAAPAITAATGVIASTAGAASAIASAVKNSREAHNAGITPSGKGLFINPKNECSPNKDGNGLYINPKGESIKLDKEESNGLYHFLKSKNFKNKNLKNVELNIEKCGDGLYVRPYGNG